MIECFACKFNELSRFKSGRLSVVACWRKDAFCELLWDWSWEAIVQQRGQDEALEELGRLCCALLMVDCTNDSLYSDTSDLEQARFSWSKLTVRHGWCPSHDLFEPKLLSNPVAKSVCGQN